MYFVIQNKGVYEAHKEVEKESLCSIKTIYIKQSIKNRPKRYQPSREHHGGNTMRIAKAIKTCSG
jgi:hypothetical protein